MQEYINFWMNFANFEDRTSKRGYWMVFLINLIIGLVLGFLINITNNFFIFRALSTLFSLAALVPNISIAVRRLRDAGYRWNWLFIVLVPLIGWIWYIVLMCKKSIPEDNIPVV